jgi:Methyltransferase domain
MILGVLHPIYPYAADVTSNGESRHQMMLRRLRALAADPVGVSRALPGQVRTQLDVLTPLGSPPHYEADESWDEDLHSLLGVAWPCPQRQRLDELVIEIAALLDARGLAYGRQTYGVYSDGDRSLCRAAWCTVRHTRPEVVIETGVARGVTSRIMLEALQENDRGHLWSIDLPYPFDRQLHAQTGVAVSDACRARWSYVAGSSRQRLAPLVAEVGPVGVFIHDSLHTARNTLFEMDQVASAMPPGGAMLIDDISTHKGFAAFARRHPGYQTIVCPSADRKGLFGIAVKAASV